jgi:hypothetical protein
VLIAPLPAPPGLAPSRPLAIFYRFTAAEAIENREPAYAALDRTARGSERREDDAPGRPRRRRADDRIMRDALFGDSR